MLDDPSNKVFEEELDNVDDNEYFDNKKSKKKSKDSYIPLKISSNHIGSIEKVSFSHETINNNYVTQNIPFYYVKTIWGDEGISKIKNYLQLEKNQNPIIGVINAPQAKQLAISLWKLRNYWQ
jgi:hypothetical protein